MRIHAGVSAAASAAATAAATAGAMAAAMVLMPATASAGTIRVVPGEGNPIQAAFDQAQDGDVILITKGTYPAGASLEGRSDITIRGLGKPVIDDTGGESDGLYFADVAGLTVKGLVFRHCTDDGIQTSTCSDVLVSKCAFEDIGGSAIEDALSAGYVVTGCRVETAYSGFMLSWLVPAPGTSGIVLRGNTLNDVAERAVGFTGAGAVITGNRILSAGIAGIVAGFSDHTTGAVISGNRVDSASYGLAIYGSDHTVARNRVQNCVNTAMSVVANDCTVERNVIADSGGYGLRVDGIGSLVRLNRMSGSGAKDLGSTLLEADNTYEKNRFETSQFGIYESPV